MQIVDKYKCHLIPIEASGRDALLRLDLLPESHSRVLLVVSDKKMAGTLTDGDIRRGLLNNLEIADSVEKFMKKDFTSLCVDQIKPALLAAYRRKELWLLPVLNHQGELVDLIDLKRNRTVLPAAALIMAGGRGERLKPLTDLVPKPMLVIGERPIIEINIDRLIKFGIKKFYISVRYLSEKIIEHLGDGSEKGVSIEYIHEDEPLGTFGACSKIKSLSYDQLFVMNADVLTNVDFEDLFNHFKSKEAKMCVASIPYKVQVPYGIMQSDENELIHGLVEKPTYTYYANAGIYLINKALIQTIPPDSFYNATDLMQQLIDNKDQLVHYPILEYWLDIGKYEDYVRAQQDYKHLTF